MKIAITVALGLAALAVPTAASAHTGGIRCVVVHDHITKADTGHGTPAEWADLSLNRTTTICGGSVHLVDTGTLWTRAGAGTPNGTGGSISHRVPGVVRGTYSLTVTGGTLAHRHGDVTLSSTEYVKSLFSDGSVVTGGAYAWAYLTRCGEKWLDSSANGDGVGAAAGNITGKVCRLHRREPSPTPTPTASPTGSATPAPAPTVSTPAGEAPVPTPVPRDLPVTG